MEDVFSRGCAMASRCMLAGFAIGASLAASAAGQDDEMARSASLANVTRIADPEPADLAADATYRLPGLIRAWMTLDDLRLTFGATNVERAEVDGAEGESVDAIVLFGADAQRRAEVFFGEGADAQRIDTVRVRASRSRWHFDDGVRPGMTLAELARGNGAPVTFNGFDWDYGGIVTDWNGGAYAQKRDEPFRSVQLGHAEGASGYPVGEGSYRSGDARYPKQGSVVKVEGIAVTFPAQSP